MKIVKEEKDLSAKAYVCIENTITPEGILLIQKNSLLDCHKNCW